MITKAPRQNQICNSSIFDLKICAMHKGSRWILTLTFGNNLSKVAYGCSFDS